jgi:hypothetical protein
MSALADALAPRILPVVLANITTGTPYQDSHVFESGDSPHDPFAAHPAFGNSFDWHSSVHSHWTALQLIERGAAELERVAARNLSAENIAAETKYLRGRPSYERPYGWAWGLLLAASAESSARASIRGCGTELRVMAGALADSALRWVELLPLPVRHGVHSNTAFAMGLMHDACDALRLGRLKEAIERRARDWFSADRDWPEKWERSGNDFLSPALTEADLMRRVLAAAEFETWWRDFLPALSSESPLLSIAYVPNVNDGQIVHLHGLNLSRATSLAMLARELDEAALLEAARRLYDASARRAFTGHYSELHWLPTFAWRAATAIDGAS